MIVHLHTFLFHLFVVAQSFSPSRKTIQNDSTFINLFNVGKPFITRALFARYLILILNGTWPSLFDFDRGFFSRIWMLFLHRSWRGSWWWARRWNGCNLDLNNLNGKKNKIIKFSWSLQPNPVTVCLFKCRLKAVATHRYDFQVCDVLRECIFFKSQLLLFFINLRLSLMDVKMSFHARKQYTLFYYL